MEATAHKKGHCIKRLVCPWKEAMKFTKANEATDKDIELEVTENRKQKTLILNPPKESNQ